MKNLIFGILPFCMGCASVHTEIVIDAPLEKVWSVILDTASYSNWNPVMVQVDGKHEIGKTLTYQVKAPDEKPTEIKAKVKEIVPNSLLRQTGGIWGVLTFNHKYELEKVKGGTKVTQHEDYSGVGVFFWDHKKMERAYKESNEALKKQVLKLKEQKHDFDS